MNKSIIILFCITSFIMSCAAKHDDEVVIPESVLSQEQMITILTDAYLGEGASSINVKNVTGQEIDSVYLFNPLKENNCSKETFDSSISFYTKNPILFKHIYDQVLERLNKIEAKGKL